MVYGLFRRFVLERVFHFFSMKLLHEGLAVVCYQRYNSGLSRLDRDGKENQTNHDARIASSYDEPLNVRIRVIGLRITKTFVKFEKHWCFFVLKALFWSEKKERILMTLLELIYYTA